MYTSTLAPEKKIEVELQTVRVSRVVALKKHFARELV